MAVYTYRNVNGGSIPIRKALASAAAIVKGCPVFFNSDGLLAACTTDITTIAGWALSATAGSEVVDFVPCYPGIQALIGFTGATYAVTSHLGKYFALTVTSGVAVVDINDASNDSLKVIELEGTDTAADSGKVWVEAAHSADQNVIEVA